MQNWQSKYNDFISTQLETKNKQEIEKTKIKASEKSIELLTKRLKILESYTMPEDQSKMDKNIIIDEKNKINSTSEKPSYICLSLYISSKAPGKQIKNKKKAESIFSNKVVTITSLKIIFSGTDKTALEIKIPNTEVPVIISTTPTISKNISIIKFLIYKLN